MHDQMISITEHASGLATVLDQTEEPDLWRKLHEWLTAASGIVSVRFDTIRYDDSHGWCAPADEFNSARDVLLQQYVTELTRFTYCWTALESMVDVIDLPTAAQRGKINSACYYIQQHSPNDNGVVYYRHVLHDFRQMLGECGEVDIYKRFRYPEFVSIRSLALYVIYYVRNSFAHGTLYVPIPDSENQPTSPYVPLIQLASRLTLMSIQHLLAAVHETYAHTWEAILDDGLEVEHEFHAFLASLHVKKPPFHGNVRLV